MDPPLSLSLLGLELRHFYCYEGGGTEEKWHPHRRVRPFMLEISSKVPPPPPPLSSSSRPKAKARLYIARLPASSASHSARGCLLIQRPIQPCSFPFLLQRQAVQCEVGRPPQHNCLYQHAN